MTKALYQVYDTHNKQYVPDTECDSKPKAKAKRRALNGNEGSDPSTQLRYIVALGKDHWKYQPKKK